MTDTTKHSFWKNSHKNNYKTERIQLSNAMLF